MGWKDKFTFRDKRYIEADVAGRTFRFYPNRMALLTEARNLSAPVAKSIATLMASKSSDDRGLKTVRQGDNEFQSEDTTIDAVSLEMATFRAKERDDAIGALFDTAGDVRTQLLLGMLIMDSLRDEFPYATDRPTADVEEFLFGSGNSDDEYTGLDAPAMVDLFKGWMQANAKVFGSSGEKMVGALKSKAADLVTEHLSETEPEASTSGSDSQTASSAQ